MPTAEPSGQIVTRLQPICNQAEALPILLYFFLGTFARHKPPKSDWMPSHASLVAIGARIQM